MESKEQIKKRLKDKYGVELTPNSDFTKLPDEILANAHLYDWYDKVSIQANVEMFRRFKESNNKAQRTTLLFSILAGVVAILQIIDFISNYLNP
ncbi:MAG: hypothetical protein A2Z62_00315 [Candidatus Terrybacteria bacterium RIFCSPLOWO2_02_42_20]|uniref:Uncharacterized protein n=1 Tax=Candidatus Terrybacteria bacterium RIFCSPLOWO2_02_42_20 TaxID=1802370 RepID=A0A1G2Q011_9BACT|nr:MAG: hypothetical protein A2Z62_00315 [Candidatus Terrybacteria bacterium RIFCSPLOWO2_02_42_20]